MRTGITPNKDTFHAVSSSLLNVALLLVVIHVSTDKCSSSMNNVTSQNLTKVNSINDNIPHIKAAKRLRQAEQWNIFNVILKLKFCIINLYLQTGRYSGAGHLLFLTNISHSLPITFAYLQYRNYDQRLE